MTDWLLARFVPSGEAMDHAGLSSGQVAYRMNVSDGAVRGWTSGRRGIDPDGLVRFAEVVGCPVEYFLYPEAGLPRGCCAAQELRKLTEQVQRLVEKANAEPGYEITSDEQAIAHPRDAHGLSAEAVAAIRRIIGGRCDK